MPPVTSKPAPTPNAAALAAREAAQAFVEAIGPDDDGSLQEKLTPVFDAAFLDYPHVVLAVSGGSDSTALMHLAAAWRLQRLRRSGSGPRAPATPTLSVLTINHGLRAEAALEAAAVTEAAGPLSVLPHTTLRWEGAKPDAGLQAAARAARFALVREHLAINRWPAIAMAHTADDQAETLLMRLARGSGVDGLGAMRPRVLLGPGQTLLRPLLGIPKAALTGYLLAHRIPWSEDPSNQSAAFERVRWRHWQNHAAAAHLGLNSAALARAATRAARASDALKDVTARTWAGRGSHAHFDPLGFATLEWRWLLDQPEEIRLRLLAGLLECIGGQGRPVSLNRLEDQTVRLKWARFTGLHGVLSTGRDAEPGRVVLTREWRRAPLQELELMPGQTVTWDRRFVVSLSVTSPAPLHLGPLGEDGQRVVYPQWSRTFAHPAQLYALPALRDALGLAAVPGLNYTRPGFIGRLDCTPVQPWFAPLVCAPGLRKARPITARD